MDPIDPTQPSTSGLPVSVPYGYDPVLFNDPAILEDLLQTQSCYAPNPAYCPAVQATIQFDMRRIVVEWLVEVCTEMNFIEGLSNTVQLLDRYLSRREASPNDLQLLAAACLFITNKIKAVQFVTPIVLVGYTAHSISTQQLLIMELLVAKSLDWDLVGVTVYDVTFTLVRYLQRDLVLCDLEAQTLLKHAEACLVAFLLDHKALQHSVSHLASAAIHYLVWRGLNWPQHRLQSLELHLLQLTHIRPSSQSWQLSKAYSRQCLANFIAQQQQQHKEQQQQQQHQHQHQQHLEDEEPLAECKMNY